MDAISLQKIKSGSMEHFFILRDIFVKVPIKMSYLDPVLDPFFYTDPQIRI